MTDNYLSLTLLVSSKLIDKQTHADVHALQIHTRKRHNIQKFVLFCKNYLTETVVRIE